MASLNKSVTATTIQETPKIRISFYWVQKLLKSTAVIILLLMLWEVAPRVGLVDRTFFPPFSKVVEGWWGLAISGDLYSHFIASIVRSLSGFGLAIVIAIPLGLIIGWYPLAKELLNPVLELFRNTAALSLITRVYFTPWNRGNI